MYNHGEECEEVIIMKDNPIKAVYDADLEALLTSLGAIDDVKAGKLRCVFCGEIIRLDNIDGIIPHNNEVVFSCNAPACRLKLISKESTDEGRRGEGMA